MNALRFVLLQKVSMQWTFQLVVIYSYIPVVVPTCIHVNFRQPKIVKEVVNLWWYF